MFFWMVLASLMGIVMFGNMFEKNKNQEDFVVPVYEAMALSTLQQHSAAERAYSLAIKNSPEETNSYINGKGDGIVPMITAEKDSENDSVLTNGGDEGNVFFPLITGYLPSTYKPQDGTRTYLFCVPKNQTSAIRCDEEGADVVKYIATIRIVPRRYEGADKMTSLKAISRAASNSKFFGMLHDTGGFLEDGENVAHQPLGARYKIQTAGNSRATDVYIPNYITCNFPLRNDNPEDNVLSDHLENRTYIVALSLMDGLAPNENLRAEGGWQFCFGEDHGD